MPVRLELTDRGRAARATLASPQANIMDRLMKEPDAVEGIRAFIDKRPPRWGAVV